MRLTNVNKWKLSMLKMLKSVAVISVISIIFKSMLKCAYFSQG